MSERLPIVDVLEPIRPRTYGECLREGWGDHDVTGPCPWVGCAHHLAWAHVSLGGWRRLAAEVDTLNRSVDRLEEFDLDALPATCALRAAEDGHTLSEVGDLIGVTRERVRQIEVMALAALDSQSSRPVLRALQDEGHEVSRPDLAGAEGWMLSREEVTRAQARLGVAGVSWAPRKGQPVAAPARELGPPARVLEGAEKAQRIRELEARSKTGAAQQQQQEEPEVKREQVSQEAGRRLVAAVEKVAADHGTTKTQARERLGLSSSTLARAATVGCTESLADRVEAGAAFATPAPKDVKTKRKYTRRAPTTTTAPTATAAPTSSIASDLARVAAVIERLGGLERAERIAEALR